MECFTVIGRDTAKDVQIKSFIALEMDWIVEAEEEAKRMWQKNYAAPRFVAESAEKTSEYVLELSVVDSIEPSERVLLGSLLFGATHGLILYSCDI